MTRALFSLGLCIIALGASLVTAFLSACNRERGAELDERQRWCEAFSRQSRLVASDVEELEWRLQCEAAGVRLPALDDDAPSPGDGEPVLEVQD